MTAIDAQRIATAAAAAPAATPQRRFVPLLFPLYVALFAAIQGVQQILVPGQIEAVDPAAKVANLGMVTALAAVTSMLGLLCGGAVSDRTTGRWGRRAPSLASSALASALLMITLAGTASLPALAGLFALLWFTLNYFNGALAPTIPDRIPASRRGVASSVVAVATPIGVIVGVNYAAQVDPWLAYAGLGAALMLATAAMLVLAPDAPVARAVDEITFWQGAAQAVSSLLSGFRSRDFALVFAARALMFFSVWNVTGYTYFIAQDFIGTHNLPGQDTQVAVSTLISVQMVACVLSAAVAGWLADRLGRTRLLVAISSIGIAAALLIPIAMPTWHGMLAMEMVVGLFFGAYLAVDFALMTLVLPDPEGEGRDMAVLNIATGAPQILSPLSGAALIAWFGYGSLFVFGALVALAAGLLVLFVKNVR